MSTRLTSIPDAKRDEVVTALYKEADAIDWENLTHGQKTACYARWMADPAIGGVLTQFWAADRARVWIKDVPMKEFARAQEGIGPFARFTVRQYLGPNEIVKNTLGDEWDIVPGSVGEKPNHCYATNGNTTRYVCWGRPDTFSTLMWAAIVRAVEMEAPPIVVVTYRIGQEVALPDRHQQRAIGRHCSVDIAYLKRELGPARTVQHVQDALL
ncbi:hypothetical protein ABIA35_004204 [Catenulispora sp. MAP12-49]|uniref:hypothetical protein n=1 Tax=Catenulispora sp. MAP12-49 TaxID=3156302 RepID=UPI0035168301